jgi:hypothetical protein
MLGAKQERGLRKGFVVSSGTSIKGWRDRTVSATEALKLVRLHMRLRRPKVTIEDELGMPVSFYQLKEMAVLEGGRENAHRS